MALSAATHTVVAIGLFGDTLERFATEGGEWFARLWCDGL